MKAGKKIFIFTQYSQLCCLIVTKHGYYISVRRNRAKKEKQPAKTEIIVQYQQNAANLGELEDKVKKQFVAEGHRAGCIKTLNIYVKPEEYKAYYVINDKFFGSVDLF